MKLSLIKPGNPATRTHGAPPRRFAGFPDFSGRGFTLIEAIISTLIVAGIFVAALTTVGAARATEAIDTERARGMLLAQELMNEILQQPFDDVDDYNGRTESPPVDRDGDALPGFTGWTRSVRVEWVRLDAPNAAASPGSGVKRVTVTVQHAGRVAAELSALRTAAWGVPAELWKGGL